MAGARELPLWPVIAAGLAAALAWNAQPFRDRSLHIRVKDLSFLPSPEFGRVLSLGQCGAASKLRWIDSFSYFELQLDRRDDRIAGTGESGFKRLYDLLIGLDPKWVTFYQHAAFNTGALTNRHDYALGFLMRGLIELPHETVLWRQAAAELCVNYGWDERQPAALEAFLGEWAAAEETENGRRLVWDWKAAMARRHHRGTAQIEYWREQLEAATPGSPAAMFIEHTIREQLSRFCLDELTTLADWYRDRHGFAPITAGDLLDADLLTTRYPQGLPILGPFVTRNGALALRDDPFGYPFLIESGKPRCLGYEHCRIEATLFRRDLEIAEIAKRDGRWPRTIDELRAAGVDLPTLPAEGHLRLAGGDLRIDWDPPTGKLWPLREMLRALPER